jgi:peptidylprolyl isomerase
MSINLAKLIIRSGANRQLAEYRMQSPSIGTHPGEAAPSRPLLQEPTPMSDQVQSRRSAGSTSDAAPLTKSEKRALAKAAAAKAAAAKRRRQALAGAFAGLAVVAVIVIAFITLDNTGSKNATNSAGSSVPSASASAAPAAPPSADAAFPPLPDGADPALAKKPVVAKGTGQLTKLTAKVLVDGKGPAARAGQQVTVNYVGVTYADGKEFDSSWSHSQAMPFQLGVGAVLPGWDQGLVGAKVGSRIQLDIPSNLAYGDTPPKGYPVGALRFVVDVLAVQ